MRTSTQAVALALAVCVSASTIVIDVGEDGLSFSPNSTTAAMGDILEFHFYPRKHNVVRGTFAAPCSQGTMTTGFYSGYMPVTAGEGPQVFQVTVNDTNPIWYYCSQEDHCQSGMVGVVNPPTSGDTLAAYLKAAALTSTSETPAAVQGGIVAAAPGSSSVPTSSMSSMMSMSSGMAATTTAGSTAAAASGTTSAAAPKSTNGAAVVGMVGKTEVLGLTGAVAVVAAFML